MDQIENSTPAPEIPPATPVQTEVEVQPAPPTPAPVQTEPPAASLVVNGEIQDERVIAALRRAEAAELAREEEARARREAEMRAAELERDNQELKKIPLNPPPAKKLKRKYAVHTLLRSEPDED